MSGAIIYAVSAALILVVIKDINPTFSLLGGVYVGIVLFAFGVKLISGFFESFSGELPSEVEQSLSLILKVTGVSICTDVCADICVQLGYTAAGKGVVMCGRINVLLMALPLVKELLQSLRVFA